MTDSLKAPTLHFQEKMFPRLIKQKKELLNSMKRKKCLYLMKARKTLQKQWMPLWTLHPLLDSYIS